MAGAKMRRRSEELTIRIYGQNLTLTRFQWELMLEDMRPDSDNAERIFARLAEGVSRSGFGAMVGNWQERQALAACTCPVPGTRNTVRASCVLHGEKP